MNNSAEMTDDHFVTDDESSLADVSDNAYLGLDYSNMPAPKMPRKHCNSFDLFALDETIAKHRMKQHQSLDHCIHHTMEQSGELLPLSKIIRDHRNALQRKQRLVTSDPSRMSG